jgi:hypothetical protein
MASKDDDRLRAERLLAKHREAGIKADETKESIPGEKSRIRMMAQWTMDHPEADRSSNPYRREVKDPRPLFIFEYACGCKLKGFQLPNKCPTHNKLRKRPQKK